MAALVTAVVVVVYYGGRATFGSFSSGDGEDWAHAQKIANYRRIVARGEAASAQRELIDKRYVEQQSRLIDGSTPTQVGAELQGLLSTLAGDAALNVLSSQILREDEKDGFRRVGVRMTLSGTLDGLTELLAAVEGSKDDLVVAHLEINRKLGASRRTTAARAAAASQAPLTVSLEVKTFLRETS